MQTTALVSQFIKVDRNRRPIETQLQSLYFTLYDDDLRVQLIFILQNISFLLHPGMPCQTALSLNPSSVPPKQQQRPSLIYFFSSFNGALLLITPHCLVTLDCSHATHLLPEVKRSDPNLMIPLPLPCFRWMYWRQTWRAPSGRF